MADLRQIWTENYSDMPFEAFAQKFHEKHYADMPFEQFMQRAQPEKKLDINGAMGSDGQSGDAIRAANAGAQPSALANQMRAKDMQADYAAKPWYARAGIAADDMARLAAGGATFGFADKISAALTAGAMSGPAYDAAIKAQRQATEDARARAGGAGMVAELGGGLATGIGTANAGVTAARFIPQATTGAARVAGLMGAGAVDGAAMGALGAAGNTDDGNYAPNVATGAALGGAIGAAAPAVVAGVAKATQPYRNALQARFSPEGYAQRMALDAMDRANMTPDQIRQKMAQAAADGQGEYMVVDALGNGGARALNGIARGNDPVASRIAERLNERQAYQGQRIEGIIREGLDAPTTAKELTDRLTKIRQAKGAQAYPQAAQEAGPVDLTAAIQNIDNTLNPAGLVSGLDDNPIQSALRQVRGQITNGKEQLSDFERARQLYMSTRDAADEAYRAGAGAKGSALKGVAGDVQEALEASYPPFAQAQRDQSNLFRATEAIEKGQELGRRGLPQDTINALAKMQPQEIGAARYGYADALLDRATKLGEGANKGRALTADKYKAELPAIARPGRADPMMRKLGREGDMFETRRIATQGSQTANNIADMIGAGGAVGAGGLWDLMGGGNGTATGMSVAGALAARRGLRALGNAPSDAAREALIKALMTGDPNALAAMAARRITARQMTEDTTAAIAKLLATGGLSYQNVGGNP